MICNVSAKPTVFMTANETGVMSATASAATSAAAMKPYVVAAVVDPSEVRWLAFDMCNYIASLHDSLRLSKAVRSYMLSLPSQNTVLSMFSHFNAMDSPI